MRHYQYLEFSANAPTASEEWTDFIPEDDFYDVLDLYHDAGIGTEPISMGDDLGIDLYRLDYSSYPPHSAKGRALFNGTRNQRIMAHSVVALNSHV